MKRGKDTATQTRMHQAAEEYVRLVLALGQHDGDEVDAYHGPEEWLIEARASKQSLDSIHHRAKTTLERLRTSRIPGDDEMLHLRHQHLTRHIQSLLARVEMLQGRTFSFDEEAQALYDVVPPLFSEDHFKERLYELGTLLPGSGAVPQRYERFREAFIIPPGRLDPVFQAAIAECRTRTNRHVTLPPDDDFVVEYVTNKSWSGYNWFKGNARSVIQLNTDLPIHIDRAVDLGAHEGYPGHHVYNALLEENLLKKRGWVEFGIYALFSPQSLIAEGTANYGIEVVFSRSERIAFEQEILFPLAGLERSKVEIYYAMQELVSRLAYAGNEAARGYLNGSMTREAAKQWLVDYALMSPDRAAQRIRFFDQYRSYVINYNVGQDLVKHYVEDIRGAGSTPHHRWAEFTRLISSPRLPSALK